MKNEEEKQATSSFEPRTSNLEPRWSLIYSLVIGELIVTIALFYFFTRVFA